MENLRWILIFAGVAILVLLYVSGRSSASASRRRDADAELDTDPLMRGGRPAGDVPRGRARGGPDASSHVDFGLDGFDVDPEDLQRPGAPMRPVRAAPAARRASVQRRAPVHDFETVSEEDFEPVGYADAPPPVRRPAGRAAPSVAHDGGHGAGHGDDHDFGPAHGFDGGHDRGHERGHHPDDVHGFDVPPGPPGSFGPDDEASTDRAPRDAHGGAVAALGGLGRRIESIGARLGAGRRDGRSEAVASDAPAAGPAPTKVVTLHVVSPDGQWLDGALVAETFEARGYTFGEMDIFHSMHRGEIVFSLARMVKPGRFDPDDIDSFATPGLVMILQLPGPVPADAAFEVLLSEAHELAARLDARVLDGERSTLSRQSAQHMRDGIREFMHRRKFHGGAAD